MLVNKNNNEKILVAEKSVYRNWNEEYPKDHGYIKNKPEHIVTIIKSERNTIRDESILEVDNLLYTAEYIEEPNFSEIVKAKLFPVAPTSLVNGESYDFTSINITMKIDEVFPIHSLDVFRNNELISSYPVYITIDGVYTINFPEPINITENDNSPFVIRAVDANNKELFKTVQTGIIFEPLQLSFIEIILDDDIDNSSHESSCTLKESDFDVGYNPGSYSIDDWIECLVNDTIVYSGKYSDFFGSGIDLYTISETSNNILSIKMRDIKGNYSNTAFVDFYIEITQPEIVYHIYTGMLDNGGEWLTEEFIMENFNQLAVLPYDENKEFDEITYNYPDDYVMEIFISPNKIPRILLDSKSLGWTNDPIINWIEFPVKIDDLDYYIYTRNFNEAGFVEPLSFRFYRSL